MNKTLPNPNENQGAPNIRARLIVWEREGSWAGHLRRILGPEGPRVYESRTFEACHEMIAQSPASIVVIQWTPVLTTRITDQMTRIRREFSAVRMLAVADRAAEPLRWPIMETGMAWLCTSPRQLAPVVEIVRRHLENVHVPQRTLEQRIWHELPWPTVLTNDRSKN